MAIDRDFNDLYAAARSLAKIQTVFGDIPQIFSLGTNANRVQDLMLDILTETGASGTDAPQIHKLIIIDRQLDLVSPLVMFPIVEATLAEQVGIELGICRIPEIDHELLLTEENECFSRIRWRKLSEALEQAQAYRSKTAEAQEDLRRAPSDRAREEVRRRTQSYDDANAYITTMVNGVVKGIEYVRKRELELLRERKSIQNIAENFFLSAGFCFNVGRLICLEGAAGVQRSSAAVLKIQKAMVAQFGVKALEPLMTLASLKLLSPAPDDAWRSRAGEFGCFKAVSKKKDELFTDCDMAVPLTVRLVEHIALKPDLGRLEKAFAGQFKSHGAVNEDRLEQQTVLVFFVGGVTLGEVSVLRHLGKEILEGAVRFVVGATNALTSVKLLDELSGGLWRQFQVP
jgi:hypothetical protein